MSRERARRRAEREHEAARAAQARARQAVRAERRRAQVRALRRRLPRARRGRRPGLLAARRRAQNGLIITAFAAVQLVTWLASPSWTARVAVLGLSVLLLPVFVTLILDRRS